jgi:hypothetical protein
LVISAPGDSLRCSFKTMGSILLQSCSGLQHLHACGCIHGLVTAHHVLIRKISLSQQLEAEVKIVGFRPPTKNNNLAGDAFDFMDGSIPASTAMANSQYVRWLAPEVITSNFFSVEADVFGYGVLRGSFLQPAHFHIELQPIMAMFTMDLWRGP